MLGKNDRRLFTSQRSYYNRFPSGVSSKVADLVSQTFSPTKKNGERNNIRQDAVVVGDVSPPMSENSFMGGMLKLLGFDGAKIGAVAVNGIIFIAQMVRYSTGKLMSYMMSQTWDWYRIIDYISGRVRDSPGNVTTPQVARVEF